MGEVHASPSSVKVPGPNAAAAARSNGRITKLSGDLCSRKTHASWSILVEAMIVDGRGQRSQKENGHRGGDPVVVICAPGDLARRPNGVRIQLYTRVYLKLI